jgi:TPR repeat protein
MPVNLFEAVRWYRLAAEQGFAIAQFNLGYCYKRGRGVDVDLLLAYSWFKLAADQGLERAAKAAASVSSVISPAELISANKFYNDLRSRFAVAKESHGRYQLASH